MDTCSLRVRLLFGQILGGRTMGLFSESVCHPSGSPVIWGKRVGSWDPWNMSPSGQTTSFIGSNHLYKHHCLLPLHNSRLTFGRSHRCTDTGGKLLGGRAAAASSPALSRILSLPPLLLPSPVHGAWHGPFFFLFPSLLSPPHSSQSAVRPRHTE